MSRIGKKPIALPKGVTVKVSPEALDIQGPKGKLTQRIPPGIGFAVADGQLTAAPMRSDPELGKFHGLARSLAANGVLGVTEGFKRELDIVGVGYRAELRGKQVVFAAPPLTTALGPQLEVVTAVPALLRIRQRGRELRLVAQLILIGYVASPIESLERVDVES
jgi:large subunit ribosomal protein L6